MIIATANLHSVDLLLSFADIRIVERVLTNVVKDLPSTVAGLARDFDRASSLSHVLSLRRLLDRVPSPINECIAPILGIPKIES